ncbi:hypothetical protein Tco_0391132 [Tanacetum coccineum]
MFYELFFYNSSDDDDEVNGELTIFIEACQTAYEASKPKIQRSQIERNRYGAHNRLVAAYFSENPQYDEATFRMPFRMSRKLFTNIVRKVTDYSPFFQQTSDYAGRLGISSYDKCNFPPFPSNGIRALLMRWTEYLQTGATTTRIVLLLFCKAIMELYGEEFLRKPTYTDMEKLYAYHEENHGFSGMLGIIDCTDWP